MSKKWTIATFNANSLRARLPIVMDWLNATNPDLLAIQETKCQDGDFPLAAFRQAGWQVLFRGQKSYNGVAVVYRSGVEKICDRLYPHDSEEDARFQHVKIGAIDFINTYIPQGHLIDSPKYQKKLAFFRDLKTYFQKHLRADSPAIWVGDLNVAPTEIDLARPEQNRDHVCFHMDARNAFSDITQNFWTDLFRLKHSEPGHYTFWDYRQPSSLAKNLGWRIDHILGTQPMVARLEKIWVDTEPRKKEKPSDHTFLVAEFKI